MKNVHQYKRKVWFTSEVFVIYLEAVNNAQGPLLIEIDKLPGMKLGVHLTQTSHQGKPCLCIDHIDPMSIADRYVIDTETLFVFMVSKTSIKGWVT